MYIHERNVWLELFKNCITILEPQSNVRDLEGKLSAADPDFT